MSGDSGQPAGADPCIAGVSLRRYAAVRAALTEPFALRQVLALEAIDEANFRRADVAWKKRLVPGRGGIFEQYRRELALAEDWLLRIVSPLHQDVDAYARFLGALALAPGEVLGATDLGVNDVSRLSRFWAAQMERDSSLESRFASLLKRGPGALPRVTADPRKLRRSRGSEALATAETARDEAAPHVPAAATPATATPAISAPGARPTLLVNDFIVGPALPFGAPSGEPPPSVPTPPMPPPGVPPDAGETAVFSAPVPAAELPFSRRPKARPPAPAPNPLGETVAADPKPAEPALPFSRRSRTRVPLPAPNPLAETFAVDTKPAGPALPFAPSSPLEAPNAGGAPTPPVLDPAPSSTPTPESGSLRLEQYASLCVELRLHPDRAPETLARYGLSPESAAAADARWKHRLARDSTLHADFQRAYDAYEAWLTASVSTPAPSLAAGPVSVRQEVPAFSLEQYASLTVDLATDPSGRAETLLRYHLTEAHRAIVEAAWTARFAREPAAAVAFESARVAYLTWLMRRGV